MPPGMQGFEWELPKETLRLAVSGEGTSVHSDTESVTSSCAAESVSDWRKVSNCSTEYSGGVESSVVSLVQSITEQARSKRLSSSKLEMQNSVS